MTELIPDMCVYMSYMYACLMFIYIYLRYLCTCILHECMICIDIAAYTHVYIYSHALHASVLDYNPVHMGQ